MIDIEKALHNLSEVKPSQNVYNKLDSRIVTDPSRSGANMPLIAFRLAIAAIVLAIFVSVSSGVILAAKGSSEGSIFFPVRQALEKIPQPFRMPTITPTPTVRIHSESEDDNEEKKATDPAKIRKQNIRIKGEDEKEPELEKKDIENENTEIENVLHAAVTPTITILPLRKDD